MSFSTFHSLETAKNSLLAYQKGIGVIGNNLANQSDPNYTRQRVNLTSRSPIEAPGLTNSNGVGQIGQGVEISRIERIRDVFVDDKIIAQDSKTSYWNTKFDYLTRAESLYNEPGGFGISSLFNDFVVSLNELGNYPLNPGARETVRATGRGLANHINDLHSSLTNLRNQSNAEVLDSVNEINSKSKQIAKLNREIAQVLASGRQPNDLMDKRDALIDDLSKLCDISVERKDNNFLVFVGSQILVQGASSREIATIPNASDKGMYSLKWADSDNEVLVNGGKLRALLDVRDVDLVNQLKLNDSFAVNLAISVNSVHREGFGANGQTGINFFNFERLPLNQNGNYDSTGNGIADSTAIMQVSGTNSMSLNDRIGIRGTITLGYNNAELKKVQSEINRLSDSVHPMDITKREVLLHRRDALMETEKIQVEYFETDSVSDVIDRINASNQNIVAHLNHKGQLTIKATHNDEPLSFTGMDGVVATAPDFAIKHLEDSGHFLTTYSGILAQAGSDGAYNWNSVGAYNSFVQNPETGAISVNYTATPISDFSAYFSLSNDIEADINNIAARMGSDNSGDGIPDTPNGIGDNSNIWKLISTLTSKGEKSQLSGFKDNLDSDFVMIDKRSSNFETFLVRMVEEVSSSTSQAYYESRHNNTQSMFWHNTRMEKSGVNMDEELVVMLSYEHAYRAAARLINVVDGMIDTIINRMGV